MADLPKVDPLQAWIQTVMPTVYDDSLSYLEFLGKVADKLNQLIASDASQAAALVEFQALITELIGGGDTTLHHHDSRYYPKAEADILLSGKANSADVYTKTELNNGQLDTRYFTETELSNGALDTRYYTETELNNGQLDTRYFTETELSNGALDTRYYTETELNNGQLDTRYFTETELSNGALDTRYYTETEVTNALALKADKTQEAWITPTLLNGWVESLFSIRYRKDSFGIVHIKGRISGGTNGTVAFILPVGYRPTQATGMLGMSDTNVVPRITVNSDGTVTINNFTAYMYLDSISFSTT